MLSISWLLLGARIGFFSRTILSVFNFKPHEFPWTFRAWSSASTFLCVFAREKLPLYGCSEFQTIFGSDSLLESFQLNQRKLSGKQVGQCRAKFDGEVFSSIQRDRFTGRSNQIRWVRVGRRRERTLWGILDRQILGSWGSKTLNFLRFVKWPTVLSTHSGPLHLQI